MTMARLGWLALPLVLAPAAAAALDRVPVPPQRPERPVVAPAPPPQSPQPAKPSPRRAGPNAPADAATAEPVPIGGPPFSLTAARACEAKLSKRNVAFKVLDPIVGEDRCGAQRPLRLDRLSPDIALSGPVTLRCAAALALASWVQETVAPAAVLHLGARLTGIDVGTSYQCRRRNNSATGKISEHGFANGIDLTGFTFAERPPVAIIGRVDSAAPERAFQAAARGAACAYFTTVLGPGTDEAHSTHLHLDMAFRSGGYRLCQ